MIQNNQKSQNNIPIRLKITMVNNFNPEYKYHSWFLRLESFKTHYIEWNQRLKEMINKDLKNKNQKDFRGRPYIQFIEELHNKMYGSLISTIYSDIEFDLSTILGSPTNISKDKSLHKKYKEKYQIDLTKIKNYKEIETLKKCANDFKHNAGISRDVAVPLCVSFWGSDKEINYKKLDIPRILRNCQIFFNDLKEQINVKLNLHK